jgi:hypothetical protein
VRQSNISFVVVDRSRASATLQAVARRAFHLEMVEMEEVFDLYRPGTSDKP